LINQEIEQSAYESINHETEDVESVFRTLQQRLESEVPTDLQPFYHAAQQQVASEEGAYLQPVNNDQIQVLNQHTARRKTIQRCQFLRLVIESKF
jgi:RNA binding exosome subunit